MSNKKFRLLFFSVLQLSIASSLTDATVDQLSMNKMEKTHTNIVNEVGMK